MYGLSTSDVNECQTNNGGCAQICNNTVGSFICYCNIGYSLGADGRSCVGKWVINKCLTEMVACWNIFICLNNIIVHILLTY